MPYEIEFTDRAIENIRKMKAQRGQNFIKQLQKTLKKLAESLTYPGLNVHAISGTKGWFEAYINMEELTG